MKYPQSPKNPPTSKTTTHPHRHRKQKIHREPPTLNSILAAFAIPAYQDYISKTQTTRVVGELAAAKTGVDAAIFAGKVPAFKDAAASGSGATANPAKENIGLTTKDAEFKSTDTRSNLLSEVKLIGDFATATLTGGSGAIVGTLGGNANIDIKGVEIGHLRAADGTWTCSVYAPATAKGWKDKYIPNGCTKSSAAITAPAAKP